MRWEQLAVSRCSIARALSVVGDRWTLVLLREAFLGATRFEQFHEQSGAARHLVASRLQHLVSNGVLDRIRYQQRPNRFEYVLTDKGEDLYPVVLGLLRWGDRWLLGSDEPSLRIRHESCGATGLPELCCPGCGEPVRAGETSHLLADL